MTTPAETALALLRESRDGSRIFTDNGRTVKKYAILAGVKVDVVTVNLETLTSRFWSFDPGVEIQSGARVVPPKGERQR